MRPTRPDPADHAQDPLAHSPLGQGALV